MTSPEIDGFALSLREANAKNQAGKAEAPHTGGYCPDHGQCELVLDRDMPPGLEPPVLASEHITKPIATVETPDGSEDINTWVGVYPEDLDSFDCTAAEESLRSLLYGGDGWLDPLPSVEASLVIDDVPDSAHQRVVELAAPYLGEIPTDLHDSLLNWIHFHLPQDETTFEETLAAGLRNILVYGSANFRSLASQSLAHLQCLDKFRTGDGGVCRITWGSVVRLDDCQCQTLSIGALQFSAIDFGDSISLNEGMQRKLIAVDKDERNQCTLLDIADGVVALDLKHKTAPSRARVARVSSELRFQEWSIAEPTARTEGTARSLNEKTIASLAHDIIHPNHDRDYRSLTLFLSPYLIAHGLVIRVFDVLHAGSGETVLRVNILGNLEQGESNGYIDIVASNGHMRRLQRSNEILPCAWRGWRKELADFIVVFHISMSMKSLMSRRESTTTLPG